MTDDSFYSNLLRATDNTADITFEKYGTITKISEDGSCSVKEEDTSLEHSNVLILNKIPIMLGDKVVIGFVDNSIYNPVLLGNVSRSIFINSYSKEELDNLLLGKADSLHNHVKEDITNFNHTHPVNEVTNLNNYRQYNLVSNNYNPVIDSSIILTCTVTDILGNPVPNESVVLYKNGSSLGNNITNTKNIKKH
ncbi:hypothetical protein [Methanobrevibacter olleyae]|uniref:Uncharacterized protein n=1 Tax=Methanobrevibacter olleyae TaxID=294671 RepID=A0A126R3T9_METOL|nr:hypothetical protein [Methanobrevibacter olleyae]AMK16335.1 hypothetical protein YLM1_1780 [Methanobrevibacter olleyae]